MVVEIAVHAEAVLGQSARVTHWVQLPFEQVEATVLEGMLAFGCGHSVLPVQTLPVPIGPVGGGQGSPLLVPQG
jgi:hypothetical protein